MTPSIRRELLLPHAQVEVWEALEHFHFSYSHSENGVRYQKCKAPERPFRLLVPDTVFQAYVVHENALATSFGLSAWMDPNEFVAKVGHRFKLSQEIQ